MDKKRKLPGSLLNAVAKDMLSEAKRPAASPKISDKAKAERDKKRVTPEDQRNKFHWHPGDFHIMIKKTPDTPVKEEAGGNFNPEDTPDWGYHANFAQENGIHSAVVKGLLGVMKDHSHLLDPDKAKAMMAEVEKRRQHLTTGLLGHGDAAGTYDNPHVRSTPLESEATIDEHDDHFAEHAKSFTPDHISAIHKYKSSSYDLNRALRSAAGDLDHPDVSYFKSRVHHLDHVTSHEVKKPITVYRGFKGYFDWSKIKPGTVINDHGYQSTSIHPNQAMGFEADKHSSYAGKHIRHIAQIDMKPGDRGYYFDRHENGLNHERELVMPRNVHFEVLKHETGVHEGVDDDGNESRRRLHIVHLRILHPDEAKHYEVFDPKKHKAW